MRRSRCPPMLAVVLALGACGRVGFERLPLDAGDGDLDAGLDAGLDARAGLDGGLEGGADDGGTEDAAVDAETDGSVPASSVRLLAPWSLSLATRARPTFRFALDPSADEGRVEICRERACSTVVATSVGAGTATMPFDLPNTGAAVFYWRVTPLRGGTVAGPPSPTWALVARYPVVAGAHESSIGALLDLDGDGFGETAIGAPSVGEVRILAGSASGASPARTWTINGPPGLGTSLATVDSNGDGLAELVVGSPGEDAIVIASLRDDGTLSTVRIGGAAGFGETVAGLGDVDGDGYGDVAVGAPSASRLDVLHGSSGGLTPRYSISGSGELGYALAGGDFDGDGHGDLAASTPDADRVEVFYGSPTGLSTTAATTLAGVLGSRFGESLAGHGDGTADGLADLVVGAPVGAGVALVFAGSASGLEPTARFVIDETTPAYGSRVVFSFDVDRNGYDDLIASDGAGGVWIYFAQARGVGSPPGWTAQISIPDGALRFGEGLGASGDTNGDRYGDVTVGAPGSSSAYAYTGGGGGLGSRPLVITGAAASDFGSAVARP